MRPLAAIFCLLFLASGPGAIAADSAGSDWKIGTYRVMLKSGEDDGAPTATLKVLKGAQQVYKISNATLRVNPREFFTSGKPGSTDDDAPPYKVGTDILSLGGPTLVVQGFSRGAHCCFDVTILYLGDHFRAMPTIPLFDANMVRFEPARGHKALAMSTRDFTFGYWRAPFSDSSSAPIVLSFDPKVHHYVPDGALMRAPLPPDLDAKVAAAKNAQSEQQPGGPPFSPPQLTQPILDLIYTGHLKEAENFLTAAWVGAPAGRDDYWSDLTTCQLRLSPFWPTVARMNGLQPAKPVGKCPRV